MSLTIENHSRLRATVFGKTAAGRAEVQQRSAGLNARQRAVLILLDGQRTVGEIETWLEEAEMHASIAELLRKGMLRIESTPPAPPAAAPEMGPKLARLKDFLMIGARQHLGLMAADLLRRIEHAKTVQQAAGVMALWHVALRESKSGKPCADELLAQARALLD